MYKVNVMKRLNKEYSLNINDYIDVKYGSVNRENPIVVYVECKSWICPLYDGDYTSAIDSVVSNCKNMLRKELIRNSKFSNKFFFDFDVKTASLRENKKSFMSFEFLVRQNEKVHNLKDIRDDIEFMFKNVIDCLAVDLNEHIFCLSKRK